MFHRLGWQGDWRLEGIDEEVKATESMLTEGTSWEDIGTQIGRKPAVVRANYRRFAGKPTPMTRPVKESRLRKIDDVCCLVGQGLSYSQIAERIGEDVETVGQLYRSSGKRLRIRRNYTAEEDETIKRMRQDGRTWREIADALGRNEASISQHGNLL